ncbi:MAG: AsmA family protein [Hyphomicrobiales bacterium]
MKILIRLFLAIVVLAVVAIMAIPVLVSPKFVAEQIATQVMQRTGRTLTFNEDPSISVFPQLAVTLNNAAISNPPGAPKGTFVAMNQMRLNVALKPLLQRRVEVKEFTFSGPRVNLLVSRNGKVNWSFANVSSDGSTGASLAPAEVELGTIKIKDGIVQYLDERTGAAFKASKVNIDVSMPRIGGPVAMDGTLVWCKEKVKFSLKAPKPLNLASGGSSPVQLSVNANPLAAAFSGAVSLKKGFALNGGLNAKAPNLRNLLKWAGQPIAPGNGLGPFSVKSQIAYHGDKITVSKATISLDDMNAQGTVVAQVSSNIPNIAARLGVDQINIDTYLAKRQNTTPKKSGWSTEPINLTALRSVSANLQLTAARILYRKTVLLNASVKASLRGGVLDAKLEKVNLYGGKGRGSLILNGSKRVPVFAGALRADGVKTFSLLRDFAGFEWLEGTSTVAFNVKSVGSSQAQLVLNLAGKSAIEVANGAIRGVDVGRLLRGVNENILQGWNKSGKARTEFSKFSAGFAISKGRASTNNLQLLAPDVQVTGKGYADLPARKLNFRLAPKIAAAGQQNLQGFAVPIKVKGPWANPRIYPDIKGILENPEQAYRTIDTMLKSTKALKNPDTKAIVKSVEKQTVQQVEDSVSEEIGEENTEALKDAGKQLLKGLFGN